MLFQFCPQMFNRFEVKALWWPLQYIDFVVLKPFCHNWKYAWGHCPFGRPILNSWLMSWDIASISPCKFPVSWCHLFCEVHQSLLQQSTTWCCHPRASRLGQCSSACKHTPFSFKHNDGHYGQTVLFLFHQTRGQKVWYLSPSAVANRSLAFLWRFWSSGFFLAERPFRLCRYRTRLTVDIDTSSIFTRSFAVVLGLICTFRTPKYVNL